MVTNILKFGNQPHFGQRFDSNHWARQGLVGHWPMIKHGKAIDVSVKRNHGDFNGGVTWKPDGRGGWTTDFDGVDGYISTNLQIQDVFSTGGTITWWAYPHGTFDDGVVHEFWGQREGVGVPEFSAQKFSDGEMYIGFNDSGNDERVVLTATAANFPQNKWVFYALVWLFGGFSTFYVNGVFVIANVGEVTTANSPSGNFLIGAADGTIGGNESFNGFEKNLRIYNRDLRQSHIAELYRNPYPEYESDIWWMGRAPVGVTVPDDTLAPTVQLMNSGGMIGHTYV